jgi:anthranilate synthase/aminodeoxychorismate synthase-like glutamine amidotransferase
MRLTVIDNYDSFTWNLVQAFLVLGAQVQVLRNDQTSAADVIREAPDRIVVSPGPGAPAEAGISRAVIAAAADRGIPLLGVCLGHQCLAELLGGRVIRVPPVHGQTSPVLHDGLGLFTGLPSPLVAARYHSLAVDPATLTPDLIVDATTADGVIMGIRHRSRPLHGVQFHPESFLTPEGPRLLARFLAPEAA